MSRVAACLSQNWVFIRKEDTVNHARIKRSAPASSKEAAKEVAQAEDSAATEEDSDTDVDEEEEGWDDDMEEEQGERAVL